MRDRHALLATVLALLRGASADVVMEQYNLDEYTNATACDGGRVAALDGRGRDAVCCLVGQRHGSPQASRGGVSEVARPWGARPASKGAPPALDRIVRTQARIVGA